MGKLISHIFRAIDFCVIKLCSLMPLREKTIVLRSIPDFSDNAHAFYDYMCREHGEEGYTLVWLVVDPSEYADRASKHRRFVRCEGNGLLLKRDFYLAVAKYVIFTHSAPIRKWRRGQLFIGTTHSASQLKGEDVRQQSERRIVFPDYKLRCGQDGLERMMQTSGMPADRFLVLGMPRLDLLFRHRECVTTLFPGVQPKLTVIALETYKQSSKGWQDSEAQSSYGLNIIEDQQTLTALRVCQRTTHDQVFFHTIALPHNRKTQSAIHALRLIRSVMIACSLHCMPAAAICNYQRSSSSTTACAAMPSPSPVKPSPSSVVALTLTFSGSS